MIRFTFQKQLLCFVYLLILHITTETFASSPTPSFNISGLSNDVFNNYTLEADQIWYDTENDVIEAKGNVEIRAKKYIMHAGRVLYYKKQQIIQAYDKLLITDNIGNKYIADFVELNSKKETTKILHMEARLPGYNTEILISAESLEISKNNLYTMREYSFTQCKICEQNIIKNKPVWQLKGSSVVMDIDSGTIKYKKAYLEFLGISILYAPYISMPSPGIKRKSGFLIPGFDLSNSLGARLSVPYYFNIAPNMDATVTMTGATKDSSLYHAEFRHLTKNGKYRVAGSMIHSDINVDSEGNPVQAYRSYIEIAGEFLFNKHLYGADINLLFDKNKTYLKKYNIKNDDILVSDLYSHHFSDNGYISMRSMFFEDLRPDSAANPVVAPLLTTQHEFKLARDIDFKVTSHAANYFDHTDLRYQKVSAAGTLKWNKKSHGYNFATSFNLRSDVYHIDDNDTTRANIYPEVVFESSRETWYSLKGFDVVIEPIAQFILSPYNGNLYVPNGDKSFMEVNSNNLFSTNHYYDLNQVEIGNRINFGVRGNILGKYFNQLSFVLGGTHNFQQSETNAFMSNIGRSYISDINLQFNDNTSIRHKAWFDNKKFSLLRNELDVTLNYKPWSLSLTYVLNDQRQILTTYPQEININLWYNIYNAWSLNFFQRSKLGGVGTADDTRIIENGFGIRYQDECMNTTLAIKKNYVKLLDIEPSTVISLNIQAPF